MLIIKRSRRSWSWRKLIEKWILRLAITLISVMVAMMGMMMTPISANSTLIGALCLIRTILSIPTMTMTTMTMMTTMTTIFCLLISRKIAPTMTMYILYIVPLGLHLQDIAIFTPAISMIPLVRKSSITMSRNQKTYLAMTAPPQRDYWTKQSLFS